jgi:hypothetical protein
MPNPNQWLLDLAKSWKDSQRIVISKNPIDRLSSVEQVLLRPEDNPLLCGTELGLRGSVGALPKCRRGWMIFVSATLYASIRPAF